MSWDIVPSVLDSTPTGDYTRVLHMCIVPFVGKMLQHSRMTRSRLYVLVDSFENDMRQILKRHVLAYISEAEALGASSFEKASQRRSTDDPTGTTSIAAYLDMQEAYDILNRHREKLPEELGRELRKNTALLNQLVPIRNRVMHGRPLQAGDSQNAINACLAFVTRYWITLRETLDHLEADAAWEPAFERQGKYSDRVLHNLPLPEYDETGLIGRSSDCQAVTQRLLKGREPAITITGEGGIGKTAVALEAAYSILDNPDSTYECILWASLKTERLTASGVQEIAEAVRDITGAAKVLGRAIDADFAGTVAELAEMLKGVKTLVIIDNLETVDGSEVVAFYEALPDSVRYLFTSRQGIGDIERKVRLGPLPERDAYILFRSFAKWRGIEYLAKLSNDTLQEVVGRLRFSPLAIRWYILAVEAGERPDLALSSQDSLLDFCVRSVYKAMQPSSKTILTVLLALDRTARYDELAILTDMTIDDLRRGVHDLLNGSMVVLEPDRERELVSGIRLTEAARLYLRKIATPDSKDIEQILTREREYRISDERRRADEQERILSPNAVRVRSELDKPTAHLLRSALFVSWEDSLDRALELIARARAVNPDYWEVDRVEGFILSNAGRVVQATAAYRNAIYNANSDEARAVVYYYFAGHLARKAHELDAAIEFARKAHEFFQMAATAQMLGAFLAWNEEFEEGQEFIIGALDDAQGKMRLIALTSLIDSWGKWASVVNRRDHRSADAAQKSYTGISIGAKEIRDGTFDSKLAEAVLGCSVSLIKSVTSTGIDVGDFERELGDMLTLIGQNVSLFESCDSWPFLVRHVDGLHKSPGLPLAVKERCHVIIDPSSPRAVQSSFMGTVCSWRERYGFISHPKFRDNVFFHTSAIDPNLQTSGSLMGKRVRFRVAPGDTTRPRAEWVEILH